MSFAPHRTLILAALLTLSWGGANARAADPFLLQDGDTWVMVGDSITAQHLHSNYFEAFCYARYPKLTFDGLVGLFGLPDMTEELRARIAADVQAVASDPAIVKQLEANNQLVRPGNSKEFAAEIDVQRSQIAAAANSLGIKPNR